MKRENLDMKEKLRIRSQAEEMDITGQQCILGQLITDIKYHLAFDL